MITYTNKQLNNLKLIHTPLDRRRKLSSDQIEEVLNLYHHRKKLNLKVKDIAIRFNILPGQITRYANYNAYLERNRRNNRDRYNREKLIKEIKIKHQQAQSDLKEYKTKLLNIRYTLI